MSTGWSISIQRTHQFTGPTAYSAPQLRFDPKMMIPPFDPRHTRAIVPTFRDWDQARVTIESLLDCRPQPAEIVLVDDNATTVPEPRWVRTLPIHVVRYEGNHGPAYARNQGAEAKFGRQILWFYFTDTNCVPAKDIFETLENASRRSENPCVAIAGPVNGFKCDATRPINRYMTIQKVLYPPMEGSNPQSIVTANAAVSALAFSMIQGFNITFPPAAGEDIDLGIRLLRLGQIAWSESSKVEHIFEESVEDFVQRFHRYGAGLARLEAVHQLNLIPTGVTCSEPELSHLAAIQGEATLCGYLEYKFLSGHYHTGSYQRAHSPRSNRSVGAMVPGNQLGRGMRG